MPSGVFFRGLRVLLALAVLIVLAALLTMLAVGLGSSDAQAATDRAPADALGACRGSYHLAGGDAQRAARDAAIERVVRKMSWLVRGIARSHLA